MAAKGAEAVDAVSGATLVDTAGYLSAIVDAAKNAQTTQAVEFNGSSEDLKLNVVYGPHTAPSASPPALSPPPGTPSC